jgi:hypothetical protein
VKFPPLCVWNSLKKVRKMNHLQENEYLSRDSYFKVPRTAYNIHVSCVNSKEKWLW